MKYQVRIYTKSPVGSQDNFFDENREAAEAFLKRSLAEGLDAYLMEYQNGWEGWKLIQRY